jgi:hypothetical protein
VDDRSGTSLGGGGLTFQVDQFRGQVNPIEDAQYPWTSFREALQHAHLYRGELFTIEGSRLGHFVTIEGLAEAIHLWLKQQLDVAS